MSAPKISWNGTTQTRSGRAKNLFSLSTCSYTRRYGQIGEDNTLGDHLAIMPTYEAGIHAGIDLIRAHYLFMGFFIPSLFYQRWSGDIGDLKHKGENFSVLLSTPPYLALSFKKSGDALLKTLAIMENGDPARTIPEGYFGQFINEDL